MNSVKRLDQIEFCPVERECSHQVTGPCNVEIGLKKEKTRSGCIEKAI